MCFGRVLRCLRRSVRGVFEREAREFNLHYSITQITRSFNHSIISSFENTGTEDWCNVANVPGLSNRNSHHCLLRWKCRLDPDIKFGYWMAEEDLRLLMSARAYHGHKSEDQPWSEISVQIPGRVGAQCAERFKKNLNPNIKKTTKWTSTEQKKFQKSIGTFSSSLFVIISPTTNIENRYGTKSWSKIAAHVGSRTNRLCVFNIKKLSRNKRCCGKKTSGKKRKR